ncbi:MAG TPA: patatin-like phospholipase family protein [Methylomirabilota bacterium]|nr:patatin-like phospholipase family protein [Methylomirabilota bacterium]
MERTTYALRATNATLADTSSRTTARPKRRRRAAASTKTINLALQGGGAHGAFTWGVLDRLLEDERIAFEGVSATSAGAMNAVVLAYGLTEGGRAGARKALEGFWRRVSHAAAVGPLQPTWLDRLTGNRSLEWSPAFLMFDLMSRVLSPYQFNPGNRNPLYDVLVQSVDFERLRSSVCPLKLYLSATNVRTGKIQVFDNDVVCPQRVLASGCLPFLFQAIEIDGEHYWDGGYMGNPAIFPLIYNSRSRDVLIIHINPRERAELPTTAAEIMNRVNEISFNSSLMREMRAISFVTKLIDDGPSGLRRLKRMLIHSIAADEIMSKLGVASKLNGDWDFLTYLRDAGRQHADAWLATNFDRLGRRSTIDIRKEYL